MRQTMEAVMSFASGEAYAWRGGRAVSSTRHGFTRDQMSWHLDDYRCSAE